MPWARLDDTLEGHRKARRAGLEAMGLWCLSISYCARYLTDGRVDEDWLEATVPSRATRNRLVRRLVEAGLFDEIGGEIWVHDYLDLNPSAEQIKAERRYGTRKKALHRDRELVAAVRDRDGDRCRYCGQAVEWTDRRGLSGGTYDHVDPAGPNALTNIVVACRGCNSRKGGHSPDDAGMPLLPPGALGGGSQLGVRSGSSPELTATKTPSPKTTSEANASDADEPSSTPVLSLVSASPSTETVGQQSARALCELLADLIVENGSKRPTITKRWLDAARLLVDADGKTPEQVEACVRWCQQDEFWRGNVLSMPKLREQYDRLRLAAMRGQGGTRQLLDDLDRIAEGGAA